MIRNNSALFISFTIHAFIAVAAFFLYQQTHNKMPSLEKRLCVSLAHFVEAAPVIAKLQAVLPKPEPKPVAREKVKSVQPVKIKPILQPVVKRVPIVDPAIKKEPIVKPVEDVIKPVVTEPEVEPMITSLEPAIVAEVTVEMVQPPVPTAEELYLHRHLIQIARLLKENLYYPRSARKRGITGEVLVAFELLKNGEVSHIDVKSGERTILNRAAIKTIERLSGSFPKPGEAITLNVPIRYQLQ